MCELLWSDPAPEAGRTPSKRGVGVAFGEDVTRAFLEHNDLDLLVRSHEVRPARALFPQHHAPLRPSGCACMGGSASRHPAKWAISHAGPYISEGS